MTEAGFKNQLAESGAPACLLTLTTTFILVLAPSGAPRHSWKGPWGWHCSRDSRHRFFFLQTSKAAHTALTPLVLSCPHPSPGAAHRHCTGLPDWLLSAVTALRGTGLSVSSYAVRSDWGGEGGKPEIILFIKTSLRVLRNQKAAHIKESPPARIRTIATHTPPLDRNKDAH